MELHIDIEKGNVNIYDIDSSENYIRIPVEEIGKTIIINNKIYSYWIEKYYKNVFLDTSSIFELVKFINKKFPENNINWFSQLYKLVRYQKLINIETKKNGINDFWSRYQFEKDNKYLASSMSKLNKDDIIEIKGNVLVQMVKYELI